jgi:hypothetical protein
MKLGKQKPGNTTPGFQCAIFCIHTREYATNDGRSSSGREISSFNIMELFLDACTAMGLRWFYIHQ